MSDKLHTDLESNGFVVIDLLNNEDVIYLHQLCDKYLQNSQTDFISSSHVLNKHDSDFINHELHEIIDEKLKQFFPELELLGGTLATKTKGKSNVEAHQDWTIVDETKFNSYNLWIPLVDTNSENGTLGLINGSHKWSKKLRGFNIPNLYGKFTTQFLKIGTEPFLDAGQAILYNHKLIHYSRPNTSDKKRNVAIIGVKERNADLQISFCLNKKDIDTYTMTESEFYQFDSNRIIETQLKLYSCPIDNAEIKWNDIYSNFIKYANPEIIHNINNINTSIWKKIINKVFH